MASHAPAATRSAGSASGSAGSTGCAAAVGNIAQANPYSHKDLKFWAGAMIQIIRHTGKPPQGRHYHETQRNDNLPAGSPMDLSQINGLMRRGPKIPEDALQNIFRMQDRLSAIRVASPPDAAGLIKYSMHIACTPKQRQIRRIRPNGRPRVLSAFVSRR